MPTPLKVVLAHRMGPEQTLSRIRTLATGARREYAERIEIHDEAWFPRGCRFDLTVDLYGRRRVRGTIQVDASHVRLEGQGQFPAFMRSRVEATIAREASRLLVKVSRVR